MKSMEERLEELTEDPEKFRKAFKVTWIVAYSMLVGRHHHHLGTAPRPYLNPLRIHFHRPSGADILFM